MISLSSLQRFALYLYFFSLNFEMFNLLGLGSTSRLTGLIYLFTVIPDYKSFLKTSVIKPFVVLWAIFWLYLSFISLLNVNEFSYKVFDITLFFNIVYFCFLLNHERKDPGVLIKGLLFFALSGFLLTIFYFLGVGLEYAGGRVSIFGDNENAVGFRLSLSAIILIYLSVTNKLFSSYWRYMLLLPVPSILLFMIETGSRKAFLGTALSVILFMFLTKVDRMWKRLLLITLPILPCIYIFRKLVDNDVLLNRLNKSIENADLAGRDRLWSAIIPYIEENIIFGGGATGFVEFSTVTFGKFNSPHNVILEVAAYTGLVGLALYLYFLLKVSKHAYMAYRSEGYLLPILLLIPVAGLIFAGQAFTTKIVWCIFAFTITSRFCYYNRPVA